MSAISLAIIGEDNEPLYMKEFRECAQYDDMPEERIFGVSKTPNEEVEKSSRSLLGGFDCSSKHQFFHHAALDRIEQLAGQHGWRKSSGTNGTDGMYVGLLSPVEESRIYGESENWNVSVEESCFEDKLNLPFKSRIRNNHQSQIILGCRRRRCECRRNSQVTTDEGP